MIDDIQEELRREDLMQQFKKRLPWIFGAIGAILLGAAGYTVMKNRQENHMVYFESLYDGALDKLNQNQGYDYEATVELQKIAKECSGLRFLALMTLSEVEKNRFIRSKEEGQAGASSKGEASPPRTLPRNLLAHYDQRLMAQGKDLGFSQFLALNRLLLDAQDGGAFFGPSPFSQGDEDSTVDKTLVPMNAQETSNILAMYKSSPLWSPLSRAVEIVRMPQGSAQQEAIRQWHEAYRSFLGPQGLLPLHILMGTQGDDHS